MTDYIKREDINKLLNDLSFVTRTVIYNRMTGHTLEDILEHDFSELPSADVVEVVRCGNCKYWQNYNDVMVCGLTNAMMSASDYCSYGERAEEC